MGDFFILIEILLDDYDVICEVFKWCLWNEVVCFILFDLDKVYEYMFFNVFVSNWLNKDCVVLVKSCIVLFEVIWEKYYKGSVFVFGGFGWFGVLMDYLKDFSFDIDVEIKYFL